MGKEGEGGLDESETFTPAEMLLGSALQGDIDGKPPAPQHQSYSLIRASSLDRHIRPLPPTLI